MAYKIIQSHIDFDNTDGVQVVVAIQSDPREVICTHYKAYEKYFSGEIDLTYTVLTEVASDGAKLPADLAGTIFPTLKNLGYY